jgi:hypothetical protein
MTEQYEVEKNIKEIVLPGKKLPTETNDLDLLGSYGSKLYSTNRDFIREHVQDNWFIAIEPVSGTLVASSDELKLFEYAKKKFPNRIFFSVGLLKNNLLQYA